MKCVMWSFHDVLCIRIFVWNCLHFHIFSYNGWYSLDSILEFEILMLSTFSLSYGLVVGRWWRISGETREKASVMNRSVLVIIVSSDWFECWVWIVESVWIHCSFICLNLRSRFGNLDLVWITKLDCKQGLFICGDYMNVRQFSFILNRFTYWLGRYRWNWNV